MAAYRIYCLNGENRVSMADWIEAKDDEEAMRLARDFHREFLKCEVWLKDRLVAKLTRQSS